ncbi:hypothetical protein GP486_004455 [Trichoglossum hirsutum]|uniref:MYG1 protein n=1 Tax=Trichoglossum hirsutum TaxID=265104 RepID=A0A9P8RPP7_9PEZI|nr:hypothetical protein GP486_004455 [Trichoglossum hirsutum]
MASEGSVAKRLKTSPPTIGTHKHVFHKVERPHRHGKTNATTPHSGHFHADEALAVYLLRQLPAFAPSTLIRTRDPALLETCSIVVDVGGEYNSANHRYDHHQRSFNETFPDHNTKLSSAGLVYLHFGRELLAQTLKVSESEEKVGIIWKKIYKNFIEAIDANDNGISVYDSDALGAANIEKRFHDSGLSIASLVGDLNVNWNDPPPPPDQPPQSYEDAHFELASTLIGEAFMRKLNYYAHSWLPARDIVHAAYAKRKTYDSHGRILVFERPLPWKDHLYTLEESSAPQQLPLDGSLVLYVLYPETNPSETNPHPKWRIQAVPESPSSFTSRKALPEAWRGLRDEKLDEVAGVQGTVFVHASGFIGGNKTWEGARQMAEKAVEM